MTARITPGRRVGSMDELAQAGDYYGPTVEVGQDDKPTGKQGLWFLLPTHQGENIYERPDEASGLWRITSPPWTFRECPDGSLEVRASIAAKGKDGKTSVWHGYLDEGHSWRELP